MRVAFLVSESREVMNYDGVAVSGISRYLYRYITEANSRIQTWKSLETA